SVLFPVTAAASGPLCLRVPLAAAVEGADGDELASTGDRNFDEVVLVDRRDGTALFTEGRDPQARLGALPGFDPKNMGVSRRIADMEIGSSRYRVFLQPLALTVPLIGPAVAAPADVAAPGKPSDESTLLLAGFVREERFQTELYQVRPTAFLWAAAMVAIAVFCWPLAKLWLVGPRTRFGRFDAAFLVTAAVIATALSALLFPMLVAQASLGQRLDRHLSSVAAQISRQLTEEVGAAARALDVFVKQSEPYRAVLGAADDRSKWSEIRAACEQLAGETPKPDPSSAAPADPTSAPASPSAADVPIAQLSEVTYRDDERRWPLCELVHAPSIVPKESTAGGRELAFWVNREGLQQLKRVTAAHGTPAVAVTGRDYFQQAIEGKARMLGAADSASEGALGVPEVVRSVTSSQKVLLVARPTIENGKTTGVAAIEVKIGALRAPLLPKGFQMAVARGDGTVMLHSKLDAHHGHSIFEDLGGRAGGELRALMAAGTSGEIDARYRGTPSRLKVALDPGTGWFVVVIASQGLLDVVVTDTSVSTLACVALFAVLLGAIAAMSAIVRGSRAKLTGDALSGHVLSLRPHTRLAPVYASTGLRMLGIASALSFLTLGLGCFVPTTVLVMLAVALAIRASLSIPGFWRPVQIPPRSSQGTWRDDLPTTYALACFGLANVFIIFPTIIFFVGAHCAAVGNLLRAEQDHYRSHLETRASCLALSAESPAEKGRCSDIFWPPDMRRAEPVDRPTNAAWFTEPALWPAAVLTDRLPLYTSAKYDTALLSRAAPDVEPPLPRSWVRTGSSLRLQPFTRAWALESDLPRLIGFDRWMWPIFVVMVFVALTAGANAVAYQTVQRLFFTDVLIERRAALAVKARLTPDLLARELPPAKHARVLILHPHPELAAKLRSDPRFAPLSEAASPCAPPKAITFVGDLEPILGHAARSERLREAIATEPSLLLLSSVDPLRQGTAEQRRLWALALKDFRVVNGPGRPVPTPSKLAHTLIPGEQPSEAAFMHEWSTSDDDERRVLAQLAIDGYASPNPKNAATLRHLAARGLLDSDTLTLRDDDFRDFLRRTVSADDLHVWQMGETALAWRAVRVPLSAGVAILLALLGVSRPDIAETSALLPPIAAGLPVLLRLLASMASGKKTTAA
ncbi:MAG: cache domain-containing protein, partial [Polyangiaceae bacterium]